MYTVKIKYLLAILFGMYLLSGCKPAKGDHPGTEYMPDMFHSIAFQANLEDYYYYNTWSSREDYYQMARPRKPVAGTIPFGEFALKQGVFSDTMHRVMLSVQASGSVPFHYPNTEEARQRAIDEIRTNPFPITDEALSVGKSMYTIYCGICHGSKGDGMGYLVRDDGGKYPVAPTDLRTGNFADTSAGAYIFAIQHGKNVMGAYADKMSYKERWDVIHYIRSLQAEEAGKIYSPEVNTYNPEEATPVSRWEFASVTSGDATGEVGFLPDVEGDNPGAGAENDSGE